MLSTYIQTEIVLDLQNVLAYFGLSLRGRALQSLVQGLIRFGCLFTY